jgi:transposase
LLKVHLELVAPLEQALIDIDAAVAPIQHSARLLTTMPGISEITAHVVVA